MFPRIGNLEASFLALMGVVGVGTAAVVTREPSWNDAALMPLLWPIAVALLFDIVTAGLRGGGLPPLPMPIRAAGVLLAMTLFVLLNGRV